MSPRSLPRASRRGFTLVELMVVVVIVGVLAAIGIASFRSRIFGSKTTEALSMIQSIRAAQERYRAESLTYLDVSQDGVWYPSSPKPRSHSAHKRPFYNPGTCAPLEDSDHCRWRRLNPTIAGPVTFAYQVNAGLPSQVMTPLKAVASPNWTAWPASSEPWYVIQAIADVDGDGKQAFFYASSLRADVANWNEGE